MTHRHQTCLLDDWVSRSAVESDGSGSVTDSSYRPSRVAADYEWLGHVATAHRDRAIFSSGEVIGYDLVPGLLSDECQVDHDVAK